MVGCGHLLNGRRIAVVMPGLNVAQTLVRTVRALPDGAADDVILVDDGSSDGTSALGRSLGLRVFSHAKNRGYGAAQKTGYREALSAGADVVVMVHPDFQTPPALVPAMASMVYPGGYDLVLGSRMLVGGAKRGGMPAWKRLVNRALTGVENVMLGAGLSEYHTGYRAFSRALLSALPLAENRNDYAFDNEVIAQTLHFGFAIGELSVPAHYFDGMQSIALLPGVRYGLGCLATASRSLLHRTGFAKSPLFVLGGRGLTAWAEDAA